MSAHAAGGAGIKRTATLTGIASANYPGLSRTR